MLTLSKVFEMPFLATAGTEATFFERIGVFLPPLSPQYKEIKRAYDYATDAFKTVERADGSNYFEHLRAVALIVLEYLRVRDYELIVAALLHDIVEDCPEWTVERVQAEFGERVALLVEYMTKPHAATKEQSEYIYHERFQQAPREFFILKMADRLHNLLTLDAHPEEKRRRKIEETEKYYLPYAEKHLILVHELEASIKAAKQLESN